MRTEYIGFDQHNYNLIHSGWLTTLDLDNFIALPLGTILYNVSNNLIYKLHSFSSPITLKQETGQFLINTTYNPPVLKSNVKTGMYPDQFFIQSFNTASTYKILKNPSINAMHIDSRKYFVVFDEKLLASIFPKYEAIKTIVKANVQYNDLIRANPSLYNLHPEHQLNDVPQAI